jgi:hypothetical protein
MGMIATVVANGQTVKRNNTPALFLVAGQSNSVGHGDSSRSVPVEKGHALEYRYTNDVLVPLRDPVGKNELSFQRALSGSAWPAFASRFYALTGREVVIVPAARGGASCHQKAELDNYGTWSVEGRMLLFENAVEKTRAAIRKSGSVLNGIIWLQGERDANAINSGKLTAEEYGEALTDVIRRFRKSLGETVPFYIVLTGYYRNHPHEGFDAVRQQQQKVAAREKNVTVVYHDTHLFENKGWLTDDIHYDQQGLNDIGKTIAEVINKK